MALTRRQFLCNSAMVVAAVAVRPIAALAAKTHASSSPLPAPALTYPDTFSQLGRISFGPTLTECAALMQQGLATYLEAQLHPVEAADLLCNARLAAATLHIEYKANQKTADAKPDPKNPAATADAPAVLSYPAMSETRPLSMLGKPVEALWPLTDNGVFMDGRERRRPADEVRAATWIRAVYSKWQLRELMVEFWHNHFNVNAFGANEIAATFPLYDAIMRRNCFGNFRAFLEEVATSVAMLTFLNNAKSKASPANENYAREMFELHTLGADHYYNALYNRWREVPGATQGKPIGYIDQDVYEAARAFTGWTIEDGSNTGRGITLPKTGKFTYFDGWHDNYQKRVLGTEFDPNAPPMADGRKVLDLVANHPGTAAFLCGKLCRRFLGDQAPPALVERAAATWKKAARAPDQIAQVLRTIILSPEFAARREVKLKRPFDFVVSYLRATGADVTPNDQLFNTLSGTGYRMYEWPTPTGHPDDAAYWLNTNSTLSNWNFLPPLMSTNFAAAQFDLLAQTPDQVRTPEDMVAYWYQRLTGQNPDAATLSGLVPFLPSPLVRNPALQKPLQEMVMTITMLPAFAVKG